MERKQTNQTVIWLSKKWITHQYHKAQVRQFLVEMQAGKRSGAVEVLLWSNSAVRDLKAFLRKPTAHPECQLRVCQLNASVVPVSMLNLRETQIRCMNVGRRMCPNVGHHMRPNAGLRMRPSVGLHMYPNVDLLMHPSGASRTRLQGPVRSVGPLLRDRQVLVRDLQVLLTKPSCVAILSILLLQCMFVNSSRYSVDIAQLIRENRKDMHMETAHVLTLSIQMKMI